MYNTRLSLIQHAMLFLLLCALVLATSACGGHTMTGQLSYFFLPKPFLVSSDILVAGPDGNFWFPAVAYENFGTNQPSGAIGRISPDGKITLFPMPALNSYPLDMVAGSDGKLWFRAVQGSGKVVYGTDTPPGFQKVVDKIGSVTTEGTFSQINSMSANSHLYNMTQGPDGHVWLVDVVYTDKDTYTYNLARVDASAEAVTLKTFVITGLQAGDGVISLLTGADGNLWFGVSGADLPSYNEFGRIGRMTPQGKVKIFNLGRFIEPRSLAMGTDGKIWFGCAPGVARVAGDGKMQKFVPSGLKVNYCGSRGMAADPAGGFYYLDAQTRAELVRHVSDDGSSFTSYPITQPKQETKAYTPVGFWGLTMASDGTLWLLGPYALAHLV